MIASIIAPCRKIVPRFPLVPKRLHVGRGKINQRFDGSTSWERAHTSESYPTPFPRSVPGCAKRKTLTQRRRDAEDRKKEELFDRMDRMRRRPGGLQSRADYHSRPGGVGSVSCARRRLHRSRKSCSSCQNCLSTRATTSGRASADTSAMAMPDASALFSAPLRPLRLTPLCAVPVQPADTAVEIGCKAKPCQIRDQELSRQRRRLAKFPLRFPRRPDQQCQVRHCHARPL